jgi:hypothetical protein
VSIPRPTHTLASTVCCRGHGNSLTQPHDLFLLNLGNDALAELSNEIETAVRGFADVCGCPPGSIEVRLEIVPWPEFWDATQTMEAP